jgi:uncharacterized protein (DUF736 family)
MATVGTFTKTQKGFIGTIRTLTLDGKVTLSLFDSDKDNAPDYRITAKGGEIGVAWYRLSQAGNKYIACKLDDTSFAAPVYANLFERGETYSMVWNR